MKYVFNEISGKEQGEMLIVNAVTAEEAIECVTENYNVIKVIKPGEKFTNEYFGKKIYELRPHGSVSIDYLVCLEPRYWYAIQQDGDDNDWGTGSHDFDKAVNMADTNNCQIIVKVDTAGDGVAVEEYRKGIDF